MKNVAITLILQCLSFVLPEVILDPSFIELHKRLNDSVLLPGRNVSKSLVFSVEWKVQFNNSGTDSYIMIYSLQSVMFPNDTAKRFVFSKENFSLWINQLKLEDDALYTQIVRLTNGRPLTSKTRLTVHIPVSTVQVTMNPSCPHPGENVTLHCTKMKGTAVNYSWQKCNQPLSEEDHMILSQDNASLTLINMQISDVGSYRCVTQNQVSQEHKDFALQLCAAEPSMESSFLTSSYYGYFGYPGYLGYICIFIFIYKWIKQHRKGNSDGLYENTLAAK